MIEELELPPLAILERPAQFLSTNLNKVEFVYSTIDPLKHSKQEIDEYSSDWSLYSDDYFYNSSSDNQSEQGKLSSSNSDCEDGDMPTHNFIENTQAFTNIKNLSDSFEANIQNHISNQINIEENEVFMLPPSVSLFSCEGLLRPNDDEGFRFKADKKEIHPESILRFLQKNTNASCI